MEALLITPKGFQAYFRPDSAAGSTISRAN
jgi:hypothetical protein